MQQSLVKYIVGLGSPLLDLQVEVSVELLDRYELKLNNTYFAGEKQMPLYDEIITMPNYHKVPGGSSLNTVRMAQWMLQANRDAIKFVGCVGNDIFSKMLSEETSNGNVDPVFEVNQEQPTGKCAVLLNQLDRCLVPLIGAAAFLSDEFVEAKIDIFKNATILFSEVYFLYAKPELTHKIYELCTKHNVKTCLTLSSQNAVTDMLPHIKNLFKYIDVVFGNEDEFAQLGINLNFEEKDLGVIAQKLAKLEKVNTSNKRLCVVTRGKETTIIATEDNITEYALEHVVPSDKIVDANAAGDSFAGGFISQLLVSDDYKRCVLGGQYAAVQCIQQPGSQLPSFKPEFKS